MTKLLSSKLATKVVSARLPIPIANELTSLLKNRGISLPEFLKENMEKQGKFQKYDAGGIVNTEVQEVLGSALLSAGLGWGIYHVIYNYIKENYPDRDADQDAFLGAFCISAGSMLLMNLSKITKR